MAETQPKVQPAALSLSAMISQSFTARLSLGRPGRRQCWLVHYGCRLKSVVALVIGDSHTCGTIRSARETVKHIARVSVTPRHAKNLTTEISDLGPVVLSA
jgi:hypothetical protein